MMRFCMVNIVWLFSFKLALDNLPEIKKGLIQQKIVTTI